MEPFHIDVPDEVLSDLQTRLKLPCPEIRLNAKLICQSTSEMRYA
jgi:hypothetical protein